ncbi:hypothetical protein [Granulicella arctica]|uniref:hypothetical protein n=1 Tax=Granulicella arctica TaxID=940613 RepID=UPI0021DFDBC7|nr:hypothetical protein [Granulicella arctica]
MVNAVGPNGPIVQNVLTPNRNSQYSIRVTNDLSPTHQLSLAYNFEHSSSANAGVGGIVLPEAGFNLQSREDDFIINDRIIVSPNLINQLQITFEKDEDLTRSVSSAPSIQVSGSFIGGGVQAATSGKPFCRTITTSRHAFRLLMRRAKARRSSVRVPASSMIEPAVIFRAP